MYCLDVCVCLRNFVYVAVAAVGEAARPAPPHRNSCAAARLSMSQHLQAQAHDITALSDPRMQWLRLVGSLKL